MTVHVLDPLRDPRWAELVRRHPKASMFHTPGWLGALEGAYGYEPMAFTTSSPTGELKNGHVFCAVRSWLTGRRLVSLPFSDHCEPLTETAEELEELGQFVQRLAATRGWRYVEMRPLASAPAGPFVAGDTYAWHRLDLRPDPDALLQSFHRDCVQRKIRRAAREGLTYEAGRSEDLLDKLYALLQLTRRRHRVPPQPRRWFRSLVECLGADACIRIASRDGQPVAGMLTVRHGRMVTYKYGGSDARFNRLGGMALLFWNAIREAKSEGAEAMDLGRSDRDQAGLIAFKEHWGAAPSRLTYWRYAPAARVAGREGRTMHVARKLCGRLPGSVLTLAGRLLYRHIA